MILTTTDCSVNICDLFEKFEGDRSYITELSLKYSSDCCGNNWIERKKYYSDVIVNFENFADYNCSQGEGCMGKLFDIHYTINGNTASSVNYNLVFESDDITIEPNFNIGSTSSSDDYISIESCASGKYTLTLTYTQNSKFFTTIIKFSSTDVIPCSPKIPTTYTIVQSTPDDTFSLNEEGCVNSGIITGTNAVWSFLLKITISDGETTSTYTETNCIFLDCDFGCKVAKYVNDNFLDERTLGIASMYYLIYSAISCGDCCTACDLYNKTKSLISNDCNC